MDLPAWIEAMDSDVFACAHRNDVAQVQSALAEDPDLLHRLEPQLGDALLHVAAHGSALDVARLLVRVGANPNQRSRHGWTPLHYAARSCHQSMVALLIDHGADVDALYDRSTPLFLALSQYSDDGDTVARWLLDHGATLDFRSAIRLGRRNDIERHLQEQPKVLEDVEVPPVFFAAAACAIGPGASSDEQRSHWLGILDMLLDHGLPLDSRDHQGCTPLHYAVCAPQLRDDFARRLLERGAAIDARSLLGQTPLLMAVGVGNRRAIDLLNRL